MRWPLPLAAALSLAVHAAAAPEGRTPTRVPSFSIEDIVQTRVPGQFVLSPTRTHAVFTSVGRYFGHPLFPAFGEDANL